MGGLIFAGFAQIVFSALAKRSRVRAIERDLPANVTSPVIMVIGLKLTPMAVKMATSYGSGDLNRRALAISVITLVTAILVVVRGRKMLSLIPILR